MVMAFFLLHLFYRYIMHSRSETPRADAIPGRETINILPPKEMGAEIMSARLLLPPSDWKLDRNHAADARQCERLLVIQETLSISLGKDLPFEIWSPRPANCFHRRQAAKLRNTDTFVEHSTADIFAPKKKWTAPRHSLSLSIFLSLGKGICIRHELREPLEEVADEAAIVRLLLHRSSKRRRLARPKARHRNQA